MTREPIALLVPTLILGGAERVMVNLSEGFARRGFDVDLLLGRAEGEYLSQVTDSVRLVDLHAPRMVRAIPTLVRYLRRQRPRALLSTLTHANIAALWAKELARVDTRLVVREANTISREAGHGTTLTTRMMPTLARWFYPKADAIVTVSEGAATDLVATANISRDRVRVLDNPIVTPELSSLACKPVSHPWFSGANGRPVVVAAGRLTAQKDFVTLIKAFAKVRVTHAARLVILGEGNLRPELESLARDLGIAEDVSLPGYVENPFAFMSRAAVFVLSSAWEGSPGVLIQAMASGAPVIATDCESGPREILAGGKFGPLVPVGDVDRMANAIDQMLGAPRRPVPSEAWQRFSQDASVDAYLEVLGVC